MEGSGRIVLTATARRVSGGDSGYAPRWQGSDVQLEGRLTSV